MSDKTRAFAAELFAKVPRDAKTKVSTAKETESGKLLERRVEKQGWELRRLISCTCISCQGGKKKSANLALLQQNRSYELLMEEEEER